MISLFLNCAKVWSRMVQLLFRIARRPLVTLSRPPVPVRSGREG